MVVVVVVVVAAAAVALAVPDPPAAALPAAAVARRLQRRPGASCHSRTQSTCVLSATGGVGLRPRVGLFARNALQRRRVDFHPAPS